MFCNACHGTRYQLDGEGRPCQECFGLEQSCCEGSAICVTGQLEPEEEVEVPAEVDPFAELYREYGGECGI